MKKSILIAAFLMLNIDLAIAQIACTIAPTPHTRFGLGFQFSGLSQFLLSWETPVENRYGSLWRIEPAIGYNFSDNESTSSHYTYTSTLNSLSVGLGVYRKWTVRAPFDNLSFTAGPRVVVTGTRTMSEYHDTVGNPYGKSTAQYLTTALSIQAGPEYNFTSDFSIAGFLSLTGSIRGRSKSDPSTPSSSWSFTVVTGTGIILRYYFN